VHRQQADARLLQRGGEGGAFARLTVTSPAIDLTRIDPTDGYPEIGADPQSIEENPLYLLATNDSRDERTRTMGSVDLNFSPAAIDWLTLEANASFDRTDFSDYTIRPKNERSLGGGGAGDFTGGSLRCTWVLNATSAVARCA